MKIYVKWYYWYMNMGDELLLLWLVNWIQKEYSPDFLYIESWDVSFLNKRLVSCQQYLLLDIKNIRVVWRNEKKYREGTFKIFGWGEVITDERKIPYNWWNYLLWFFGDVVRKNFAVVWWIWTQKKIWTWFLYTCLLWRAQRVVVRDTTSHGVASMYKKTELYHDFCYDLLTQIQPINPEKKPYIIFNINKYLRNNPKKNMLEKIYIFFRLLGIVMTYCMMSCVFYFQELKLLIGGSFLLKKLYDV